MFLYFDTLEEALVVEQRIHQDMLKTANYYAQKWADITREVTPKYSNGVGNPPVGSFSGRYGVVVEKRVVPVLSSEEITLSGVKP